MKLLLIIDIDNTLAENEQRKPLLPNWEAFFKACDTDTTITPVIDAIKPYLHHELIDSIFVTGRNAYSEVKKKTVAWLKERDIDNVIIHYRPIRDFSKSYKFKQRVLDAERRDEHYKVMILDDDERIIEHFKSLGHTGVLVTKENDYQNTVKDIHQHITDLLEVIRLEKEKMN